MVSGLILAAGIWWMIQPVSNAVPPEEPPIEVIYGPWVCVGGIAIAALAGIVLLRRYLLVKEILRHGTTIQGTVEETDVYDTNMRGNTSTIQSTRSRTYAYYVSIRYAVHGFDRTVRIKLFMSPSTYGMKKGGEVDLIVLDSVPHKPLIRAVYLGRTGM
ncbi:MAG: hypothetical protein ACKVT0_21580 [Planctomycetaceae bacterium]